MSTVSTARQVGQIVRRQRTGLGLTQRQLAERSGISERSVVSLELGDATGMRLDKLLEVLSALGLSMDIRAEGDEGEPDSRRSPASAHDKKPGWSPATSHPASGAVLAFLQQAQNMQSSDRPSGQSR